MTRLAEYKAALAAKVEAFDACMRSQGRFKVGPTNKGGVWLCADGMEKITAMSVQDLRDLGTLITTYLEEVV